MSRYEDNKKLLKILENYLDTHKDIRFIQALWDLGIITRETNGEEYIIEDRFYEEPSITLERI